MMDGEFKLCRWSTVLASGTVMAAFFIPGCGNDKSVKPEEIYFPAGAVVYENRAEHLGSPPDIYMSPLSEDRELRSISINLTNNPAKDIEPVFSPDGTKVYFSSNRNGDYDLFEIDITDIINPTLRQLTDYEGDETNATVHPNGTELFFMVRSNSNMEDDIFKFNLATGDTSMVYKDAGKTNALRYIPQQGNFLMLHGVTMLVLNTQSNTSSLYANGEGTFEKWISACDLSKDGFTMCISMDTAPVIGSTLYMYGIFQFPFGATETYGLSRAPARIMKSNWYSSIRDIDGEYFLYTELSEVTFQRQRIRVRVPGTSIYVGQFLKTQIEGNNSNSDYTTREVFAPPPE